jgi:hypothetical protein
MAEAFLVLVVFLRRLEKMAPLLVAAPALLNACAAPRHAVAAAAVLQRFLANIVFVLIENKIEPLFYTASHHATQLHRLQFFRDS